MNDIAKAETMPSIPADKPDAIMAVIERAASNPDVDIEKMERLLAMKERVDNRNAEIAFNEAMAAVQEAKPQVYRNARNDQTKSRFATYEALDIALTPVITRNGFACSFGTDVSPLGPEMIRILCCLTHTAGHSKNYHCDLPIDMVGLKGNVNKTKTHGTGSTMSYGRRYLKLLIFDVAVTNEDNDAQTPIELVTANQVTEIRARLKAMDSDEGAFCQYLQVASLPEMPASLFNRAMQAVEAAEKARAKNSQ